MRNHLISAWPDHPIERHPHHVVTRAGFYTIRIKGRLGATALSAFPSMAPELRSSETVLTGWIEDRSALFGVIAQIEGLGLELLEVRRVVRGTPPASADE